MWEGGDGEAGTVNKDKIATLKPLPQKYLRKRYFLEIATISSFSENFLVGIQYS